MMEILEFIFDDILFNNFLFWFVWLPLIYSISIIVVFKKDNKKFIRPLLIFLAAYYTARTIFYYIL